MMTGTFAGGTRSTSGDRNQWLQTLGDLQTEFARLQLTGDALGGKRVFDVGCNGLFHYFDADIVGIGGICRAVLKYVRTCLNLGLGFTMDLMSSSS